MSIDVLTVVGARPQFIKAAVMSKEFQQHANIREQIVHTGQHYDANMSQIFFDELGLPSPKNNLGISGGSHAEMTASMMVALENCMALQQPDCVLLYGDTNSTLAAALAAAKLDIPICHAESGARTRSRSNPEEINRICTDHLASANCAPTPSCYENLIRENLSEESYFTGDLMFDAFGIFLDRLSELDDNRLAGGHDPRKQYGDYCYLTCHRQENTSTAALRELLNAIEQLPVDVVYPVHPRMKKMISELLNEKPVSNLILLDPVGYFDSLNLLEDRV